MTIVVFIVFFIPNYFNHGVKSLDNSRISDIWVQSEYANQAVSALYNESELKAIKEMSKYVDCIEAVEYRSSVNIHSCCKG